MVFYPRATVTHSAHSAWIYVFIRANSEKNARKVFEKSLLGLQSNSTVRTGRWSMDTGHSCNERAGI